MTSQVHDSQEDSFNVNEAEKLFAKLEFEQKRDEESEGDNNDIVTTTAATTKHGYNQINSKITATQETSNKPLSMGAISNKAYFTAGYYIILHLLLLYCVVAVTYVLIVINNDSSKTIPFTGATFTEVGPTAAPTKFPTHFPFVAVTETPSNLPTFRPTAMPTYEYELYRNHVGDYKISAQNQSHGSWLLCDGQFIDSKDYIELYEIIGHSFGSFPGYPSLFALPNATDRVIGAAGIKYQIGALIGQENMMLTENHLPSHTHNLAVNGGCANQNAYSVSQPYLAGSCGVNSNWGSYSYGLKTTTTTPNAYPSSAVGNGQSFKLTQPTVIVGNLFIFAGK